MKDINTNKQFQFINKLNATGRLDLTNPVMFIAHNKKLVTEVGLFDNTIEDLVNRDTNGYVPSEVRVVLSHLRYERQLFISAIDELRAYAIALSRLS